MDDARKFNIQDREGRFLCPACGLPGYFQGNSYDERGGVAATGICPCCLWEPGFDDMAAPDQLSVVECLRRYRAGWSSLGPAWSGPTDKIPVGWNGKVQLERLSQLAPFAL